jgi:hypothetical protein
MRVIDKKLKIHNWINLYQINDILTSVTTANTSRNFNFIKTFGEDTMTLMTNVEIRGIMHDGFIGGTDTSTVNSRYTEVTVPGKIFDLRYNESFFTI